MIFYEFCSFDKPFYSNACNLLSLHLQFKGDFKEISGGLLFRMVLNKDMNWVLRWYRGDCTRIMTRIDPKSVKILRIVMFFSNQIFSPLIHIRPKEAAKNEFSPLHCVFHLSSGRLDQTKPVGSKREEWQAARTSYSCAYLKEQEN
jgi:hypothetical protein